jgi:hypothetical protein
LIGKHGILPKFKAARADPAWFAVDFMLAMYLGWPLLEATSWSTRGLRWLAIRARQPWRSRRILAVGTLSLAGLVAGLLVWHWQRRSAVVVAVGVDLPLVPGAAINPSDRHTADLYLEDHPGSRLRLVNHFNGHDPASGPASIAALKRQGVRFFITTQSSTLAVPSLKEFADGTALAINVSAVSNRLSGHDDYFLRIVPDVRQEQRAIARRLAELPGRRLLVLQDTSNPGYTNPAFAELSAALVRVQGS